METNNIGLTDDQIETLISKYGKEAVVPYCKPGGRQEKEEDGNLLQIIQNQNNLIEKQVEIQNQLSSRLIDMNERLLSLLERLSTSQC